MTHRRLAYRERERRSLGTVTGNPAGRDIPTTVPRLRRLNSRGGKRMSEIGLGQIVFYTDGDGDSNAAIVTYVRGDGSVNLYVFFDDGAGADEARDVTKVRFAELPRPGTWSLSPRV